MVVNTGLNTEGLRSPAARQSATNALPKPNQVYTDALVMPC